MVSAGCTYKNLEGPVFGTRVGIYHTNSLDESLNITDGCNFAPLDQDNNPYDYRVVLSKLPHGAVEHSHVDEYLPQGVDEMVATVSRPDKARITQCFNVVESNAFPVTTSRKRGLSPVPEEATNSSASATAREEQAALQEADAHALPGERVKDDPDAEPLSDEEDISPPSDTWWPTPQQLKDLKIVHDNHGHPTASDFARIIKLGNGMPALYRWVKKHFKCDDCEANKRPRAKRPSAVPKT